MSEKISVCLLQICAILAVSASISYSQKSSPERVSPRSKKTIPSVSPSQRQALENLDRVALEARQVENPAIRADLQALIGDALWDFDKPNAKSIFADAFKNARALDDKRQAEEVTLQVLRRVWARDRAFAEELMKQLSIPSAEKSETTGDFGLASQFGMRSTDPVVQQRLNLANTLLEDDAATAGELIASSLRDEVTFAGISRLMELRTKEPETANIIFKRAIGQLQFLQTSRAVLAAIAMGDYAAPTCSLCPPKALESTLTQLYFFAALKTLRRSLGEAFVPPPVKPELQRRIVQYFHQNQAMLALILMKFSGPTELDELSRIYKEQLQHLEASKQQALQQLNEMQTASDRFEVLFRRAESIAGQEQRDQALFNLTHLALRQELTDELVERLATKIEMIETKPLRDKAWSQLRIREVEKLIAAGDFESAHTLSLKLPDPFIRARALQKLSAAVAKKGSETLRSADLLAEAMEALKKADATIERSQTMFRITSDLVNLKDYDKAFEALQLSSESLGRLTKADFEQSGRDTVPNSLFNYYATFGRLGRIDFDKAIFLAQAIKWREFRLAAEIATCRSLLSKVT